MRDPKQSIAREYTNHLVKVIELDQAYKNGDVSMEGYLAMFKDLETILIEMEKEIRQEYRKN